ncbi:unnamed protein product [Coffea canephora]|uniref:DH200=94 genomic scaffold, scaffold_150 n=1 Tax=Coffea canephora TaxID=49390 RepID=A0A068V952_COFCA|nr:unnamed protein product [Coffea canephora]
MFTKERFLENLFLHNGAAVWCIGFQKIQGQGLTILGDLVLKDKIVVYDLAGQRIGWANYDCKFPYQEHFPVVDLIFTVPSIHHLSDWIKRGNLD